MLTVIEAADRLRVSPETVRRWVRLGDLAGVHVGRKVLIAPAEVERVLSAGLFGSTIPPAPQAVDPPAYVAYREPAAADRRLPRIIG